MYEVEVNFLSDGIYRNLRWQASHFLTQSYKVHVACDDNNPAFFESAVFLKEILE